MIEAIRPFKTETEPAEATGGQGQSGWRQRLLNLLVRPEPQVPESVLGAHAARFSALPTGGTVCIKLSCAYDLPYPFAASPALVARVVAEIHAANPGLRILLTEGGVGRQSVLHLAERQGLTAIAHATFVDAEAGDPVFVPNPCPTPYRSDGFHLPAHWVHADARVILTTCKLRSHHFQRWFSGGTRCLIGLLPRRQYRLSSSRRDMRSVVHQQGMDAMVADLYATTGRDVLTVLDCRLLARQDEHLPLRFTRHVGQVLAAADPCAADTQMGERLRLPFLPPYLALIAQASG
jgi:uncharacterized protein (DUF362 family)